MKNKMIKNLAIVTVTLLGSTYILDKYRKNRKKKERIKKSNKTNNEILTSSKDFTKSYISLYPKAKGSNCDYGETSDVTVIEVSERENTAWDNNQRTYYPLNYQKTLTPDSSIDKKAM